jgi:hypothetical protein
MPRINNLLFQILHQPLLLRRPHLIRATHPIACLPNIQHRHRDLPVRLIIRLAQRSLIFDHSVVSERVVVLHWPFETAFAHAVDEAFLELWVFSVGFQLHARVFPLPFPRDVLPHRAGRAEHLAHPDVAAAFFGFWGGVDTVVDFPHALEIGVHELGGVGGAEEVPVFPLRVAEDFGCGFVCAVQVEGVRAGDLVGEGDEGEADAAGAVVEVDALGGCWVGLLVYVGLMGVLVAIGLPEPQSWPMGITLFGTFSWSSI